MKVAFIDMGHSKTSVTVAEFNANQTSKIVLDDSNLNLGGRNLDEPLFKMLIEEFLE